MSNPKLVALAQQAKARRSQANREITKDQEDRMKDLEPSEKQKGLLHKFEINCNLAPLSEGGINMLQASELIDEAIKEAKAKREAARALDPTEKQINFLLGQDLTEKEISELTRGDASDLITLIKK